MMLTAIPANPNYSLFAHNRPPPTSSTSQPGSPETDPPPPQGSAHIVGGGMDGKAAPGGSSGMAPPHASGQGQAPQVIPMSAIQQPFLVGTGAGGYTLWPSIQQLGNHDGQLLGIQPLSALSTLPRTGTTVQPLAAIPSGYYGRVQAEPGAAMGFQQQPIQLASLSPPTPLSATGVASPTSSRLPQPPPPHHLLVSGTGSGMIMNCGRRGMEAKPAGLQIPEQQSSVIVEGKMSSVLSPPPSSSSSSSSPASHLPHQKASSNSDPDICHRTSVDGSSGGLKDAAAENQSKRRSSHDAAHLSYSRSRAVRHATRSSTSSPPPVSASSDSRLRPQDVMVKLEPASAADDSALLPHHHHHHAATTSTHARRNSDSNLEETAAASSSKSYQISALIDIPPMAPPLNRASRTSSLSSSLSSFRFGGSLSQLWASQISLSGKINNMKSTGNLNADAAAMPSLGNQYFAFGGSLPELSLTSLTRLLPNSSSNDPGISSCPGLFTLPLYVYPSQQHLATPFINTHGSISFGSFLSSGSSLCSTSKGPIGGSASSNVSADRSQSGDSNAGTSDDKPDGCGQAGGSASLLPESVIKLPMYSPPSGTILGGGGGGGGDNTPSVITSLPGFGTLPRGMEQSPMDVSQSNSNHSIANITSSHTSLPAVSTLIAGTSAAVINRSGLTTLGGGPCIGVRESTANTLQLHPQASSSSDHAPRHLPIHHNQPPAHIHAATTPDNSPVHSDLYMGGSRDASMLQTVPISRIKMERDLEPLDLSPVHGMPIMSPEGGQSPHSAASMVAAGNIKGIKKEKEKPYKCDHPGCGRSFSFPAHLRSHIQQIHISYRPCKCEFPGCGKRFYTPQHLNVHRRVHTGERPFVCPYSECSKAFTTAGNLKNHIRTHTGERPYACKFEGCSKRFAEMSSLKKHELTHTGEKPYKCRVCGKAFSQAGSRNTHERKHSRTAGMAEEGAAGEELGGSTSGVAAKGSAKKYRIKRISANGSVEEPMQTDGHMTTSSSHVI